MSTFSSHRAFNLAPMGRQFQPYVWLVLAAAACLFLICAWLLSAQLDRLTSAQNSQANVVGALKRQAADTARQQRELGSLAALAKANALNKISALSNLSWDGLFDVLEVAADRVQLGVSLIAMIPVKITPDAVHATVTAIGINNTFMLAYVKALQMDPRVVQVDITSQQPDDSVVAGGQQFQMALVVNPQVRLAHPPRPVFSAATTPQPFIRAPIVPASVLLNSRTGGVSVPVIAAPAR